MLEYGTEKPIPDATVYQSECDGEIFGSIYCWTIDSATTDAQGHYAFTTAGGLTVSARAAGYFSSDLQPILSGGATPADIILYPHAWLRVTIKNESGAYEFIPPSNFSGGPRIHLPQGHDSIFFPLLVRGNKEYFYGYGVYSAPDSPGQWITLKPFCPSHDTTNLAIIY